MRIRFNRRLSCVFAAATILGAAACGDEGTSDPNALNNAFVYPGSSGGTGGSGGSSGTGGSTAGTGGSTGTGGTTETGGTTGGTGGTGGSMGGTGGSTGGTGGSTGGTGGSTGGTGGSTGGTGGSTGGTGGSTGGNNVCVAATPINPVSDQALGLEQTSGTPTPSYDVKSDGEIIDVVMAINTGEIKEGQLAQANALNPKVQLFAREMVLSHNRANEEKMTLIREQNLQPAQSTLSRTLNAQAASELQQLQNACNESNCGAGGVSGGTTGGTSGSGTTGGTSGSGSTSGASGSGSYSGALDSGSYTDMTGGTSGGTSGGTTGGTTGGTSGGTTGGTSGGTCENVTVSSFDEYYLDHQVTDHRQAVQIIEALIPQAENEELRAFLTAARFQALEHLEFAIDLQSTLRSQGSTGGTTGGSTVPSGTTGGSESASM